MTRLEALAQLLLAALDEESRGDPADGEAPAHADEPPPADEAA